MAIINVKDYGAVGDGSTDDTDAIQAAIAACDTGDTLYFPGESTGGFADKLGVNATLLNQYTTAQIDALLNAMAGAGIKWLRTVFNWEYIEGSNNTPQTFDFTTTNRYDYLVDACETLGINILGNLSGCPLYWSQAWNAGWPLNTPIYPPDVWNAHGVSNPTPLEAYENYITTVVNRYPTIRYWEIWNEENILYEGPSWGALVYADFMKLISTAYPLIKNIDSELTVMVGGASGIGTTMFTNLLDLGLADYTDDINYHPYVNDVPNDSTGGTLPKEDQCRTCLTANKALFAEYSSTPPVWITEVGWASVTPYTNGVTVTEQQQADYWVRSAVNYLEQDVDRVFWYDMWESAPYVNGVDTDPYPVNHMGLLHHDFSQKPLYKAFADLQTRMASATSAAPGVVTATGAAEDQTVLEVHSFNLEGGNILTALWRRDDTTDTVDVTYGGSVVESGVSVSGNPVFLELTGGGPNEYSDAVVVKDKVSVSAADDYIPAGPTEYNDTVVVKDKVSVTTSDVYTPAEGGNGGDGCSCVDITFRLLDENDDEILPASFQLSNGYFRPGAGSNLTPPYESLTLSIPIGPTPYYIVATAPGYKPVWYGDYAKGMDSDSYAATSTPETLIFHTSTSTDTLSGNIYYDVEPTEFLGMSMCFVMEEVPAGFGVDSTNFMPVVEIDNPGMGFISPTLNADVDYYLAIMLRFGGDYPYTLNENYHHHEYLQYGEFIGDPIQAPNDTIDWDLWAVYKIGGIVYDKYGDPVTGDIPFTVFNADATSNLHFQSVTGAPFPGTYIGSGTTAGYATNQGNGVWEAWIFAKDVKVLMGLKFVTGPVSSISPIWYGDTYTFDDATTITGDSDQPNLDFHCPNDVAVNWLGNTSNFPVSGTQTLMLCLVLDPDEDFIVGCGIYDSTPEADPFWYSPGFWVEQGYRVMFWGMAINQCGVPQGAAYGYWYERTEIACTTPVYADLNAHIDHDFDTAVPCSSPPPPPPGPPPGPVLPTGVVVVSEGTNFITPHFFPTIELWNRDQTQKYPNIDGEIQALKFSSLMYGGFATCSFELYRKPWMYYPDLALLNRVIIRSRHQIVWAGAISAPGADTTDLKISVQADGSIGQMKSRLAIVSLGEGLHGGTWITTHIDELGYDEGTIADGYEFPSGIDFSAGALFPDAVDQINKANNYRYGFFPPVQSNYLDARAFDFTPFSATPEYYLDMADCETNIQYTLEGIVNVLYVQHSIDGSAQSYFWYPHDGSDNPVPDATSMALYGRRDGQLTIPGVSTHTQAVQIAQVALDLNKRMRPASDIVARRVTDTTGAEAIPLAEIQAGRVLHIRGLNPGEFTLLEAQSVNELCTWPIVMTSVDVDAGTVTLSPGGLGTTLDKLLARADLKPRK